MRLTRLFMLTSGVLVLLVSMMLGRAMWQDWRTVQSAQQGLQAMELAYLSMKVAEKASAERGPVIPVVNDTVPADPAKRERLNKARAATDTAFAQAYGALNQSITQPLRSPLTGKTNEVQLQPLRNALEQLQRAQQQLIAARQQVDAVAALPYPQRTAPGTTITRAPIDQMFAVIDTLLNAISVLSAQAELIYPELSVPLVSARYGAELREYAGRLGSQFTTPLATQRALGEREQRDIPQLVGRINQLRSLIELGSRSTLSDKRVGQAIETMNQRYFTQGIAIITQLTQAGTAGQPYGMDSATFVSRYVPEMLSIVQLRDTMFEVARDGAMRQIGDSQNRLGVNAVLGLCIVLIEILVFGVIQLFVLRPLLKSTHTVVAIAKGDLDQAVHVSKRIDEIGDMQRAVHDLKQTNLQKKALEQERDVLIEQLKEASLKDYLTGLPNRRAFVDYATAQLKRAKRLRHPVALMVFDIDHFKRINDEHGHEGGDAILVQLTQVVGKLLRDVDQFTRYGGEEFTALLLECDPDNASIVAQRLRQAVETAAFKTPTGRSIRVTSSFGVCSVDGDHIESLEHLLRLADEALYEAKEQGRNKVVHKHIGPWPRQPYQSTRAIRHQRT